MLLQLPLPTALNKKTQEEVICQTLTHLLNTVVPGILPPNAPEELELTVLLTNMFGSSCSAPKLVLA